MSAAATMSEEQCANAYQIDFVHTTRQRTSLGSPLYDIIGKPMYVDYVYNDECPFFSKALCVLMHRGASTARSTLDTAVASDKSFLVGEKSFATALPAGACLANVYVSADKISCYVNPEHGFEQKSSARQGSTFFKLVEPYSSIFRIIFPPNSIICTIVYKTESTRARTTPANATIGVFDIKKLNGESFEGIPILLRQSTLNGLLHQSKTNKLVDEYKHAVLYHWVGYWSRCIDYCKTSQGNKNGYFIAGGYAIVDEEKPGVLTQVDIL